MAVRIAPLDDNLDFPAAVAARQAARLGDTTTAEGKAVEAAAASAAAGKLSKTEAASTYSPANKPLPLAGSYDTQRNLYNYKPAQLRRFRSRLGAARAGLGQCRIATLGDSITAGEKAAPVNVNSWPVRLRDILKSSGVPVAGTGMVYSNHGQTGVDPRWVYSAGWAVFAGAAASHLRQTSTVGATATFTSDLPGTTVEVQYSNASGAFTVSIDGAAPVTMTGATGQTVATYSVADLPNTTHTVVITHVSGTIYPIAVNVSTPVGLLISNGGIGGSTALSWQGPELYRPTFTLMASSPDLVTISLMTNDANLGQTPAEYKTNMQTTINRVKANSSADIVLIAAIPSGNSFNLAPFRQALYELADTNDLPLIDFFDRWGSYSLTNGLGMMADTLHPNAAGYADLGLAVASAIVA